MSSRYAWYDQRYTQLSHRAGVGRLQVAVNDVGLITDVTISPSAPEATDARPRIADVILSPGTPVQADGRWVGWEWQADTSADHVVSYRVNGAPKQVTIAALPLSPSGVVASETRQSPIHTGVWLEHRRIRLEAQYPADGITLNEVTGDDVALLAAQCNSYYVGLTEGRLRLYDKTNYSEIPEGTNVNAEVQLVLIRHRL